MPTWTLCSAIWPIGGRTTAGQVILRDGDSRNRYDHENESADAHVVKADGLGYQGGLTEVGCDGAALSSV
jgi:hypothetical protein